MLGEMVPYIIYISYNSKKINQNQQRHNSITQNNIQNISNSVQIQSHEYQQLHLQAILPRGTHNQVIKYIKGTAKIYRYGPEITLTIS